jgi:hypothetical protein
MQNDNVITPLGLIHQPTTDGYTRQRLPLQENERIIIRALSSVGYPDSIRSATPSAEDFKIWDEADALCGYPTEPPPDDPVEPEADNMVGSTRTWRLRK